MPMTASKRLSLADAMKKHVILLHVVESFVDPNTIHNQQQWRQSPLSPITFLSVRFGNGYKVCREVNG
jgi:hypothetical protein